MFKKFIMGITVALVISAVVYYFVSHGEEKIVVFCAGSLAVPFKKISENFEKIYGCTVYLEAGGSVAMARKMVELGEKADVLAVADYNVIERYIIPEYASSYTIFASNELVIAYTNKSKYSNEINSSNWYEILKRKDVKIGISSPNQDPCGYRSIMLFKLSDIYYNDSLFSEIIEKNLNVRCEYVDGNFTIYVSDDPSLVKENSRIYIKPKSVELLSDLEASTIDYAFEYKSVAVQHNLNYLELPDYINLGNSSLRNIYSKIKIILADENEIKGDAIMYAVTIPNNAENKEMGEKFYNYLMGEEGKKILTECGMNPLHIEVEG